MGEYQKINVYELKEHPNNTFYFDDMTGGKWEELLESIRTSGVFSKIIITKDKMIVAGHQRVRACKELGIDEIGYEIVDFKDNDEITKCLIETNTKQKGTVADSDLKQGRRYKELERIYGVYKGNHKKENPNCSDSKSQKQLAYENGVSVDTWNNKKNLTNLIPELQQLMLDKKLTTKVALIYSAMPPAEQMELYNEFGHDRVSEMKYDETKREIELLRKKSSELEQQKQHLQSELQREKSRPPIVETKVVEKVVDNTDYKSLEKMKLLETSNNELNNKTISLEKSLSMTKQLLENYKTDSEEYRKLKLQMSKLQVEMDSVAQKQVSVLKITELASEIEFFLFNKLAPTKYKDFMNVLNDDDIVKENFIHTIEMVGSWYREMKTYINENNYENIITVEVN